MEAPRRLNEPPESSINTDVGRGTTRALFGGHRFQPGTSLDTTGYQARERGNNWTPSNGTAAYGAPMTPSEDGMLPFNGRPVNSCYQSRPSSYTELSRLPGGYQAPSCNEWSQRFVGYQAMNNGWSQVASGNDGKATILVTFSKDNNNSEPHIHPVPPSSGKSFKKPQKRAAEDHTKNTLVNSKRFKSAPGPEVSSARQPDYNPKYSKQLGRPTVSWSSRKGNHNATHTLPAAPKPRSTVKSVVVSKEGACHTRKTYVLLVISIIVIAIMSRTFPLSV